MASSADNKKPRGRPPTGIGTLVGVRLQPDQLALVDAWRERHGVKSRPEAIREMVAALIRMGGLEG